MSAMKDSATKYRAPKGSGHLPEEERQWLKIMRDPDPVKGMLLMFIQTLGSAFHELSAALEAGALGDVRIGHIRRRLIARSDSVLERLRLNGRDTIDGAQALEELKSRLSAAATSAEIAVLSEDLHLINHRLCNALVASPAPAGEKRSAQRFPLDVTVDYGANARAGTKDMGTGGLCLITDKPLVKRVVISLLFRLPGVDEKIEAFGKVRWNKQVSEHLWENGVEFEDISEKDRVSIAKYFASN